MALLSYLNENLLTPGKLIPLGAGLAIAGLMFPPVTAPLLLAGAAIGAAGLGIGIKNMITNAFFDYQKYSRRREIRKSRKKQKTRGPLSWLSKKITVKKILGVTLGLGVGSLFFPPLAAALPLIAVVGAASLGTKIGLKAVKAIRGGYRPSDEELFGNYPNQYDQDHYPQERSYHDHDRDREWDEDPDHRRHYDPSVSADNDRRPERTYQQNPETLDKLSQQQEIINDLQEQIAQLKAVQAARQHSSPSESEQHSQSRREPSRSTTAIESSTESSPGSEPNRRRSRSIC